MIICDRCGKAGLSTDMGSVGHESHACPTCFKDFAEQRNQINRECEQRQRQLITDFCKVRMPAAS